ncbi:hypothetical protein C5C94_14210 [Rathayibacter sp. AY1C3]|nr:hypothetical protein C5B92_12375 [Rathayibacter sp. AY1A4]PPG77979.1 hypothetical protein C5C52_13920 [Rathayibacter sp. AY1E5]PPH28146.1 hypothetical protein C5C94_14210 [Rathayibacter sp. AY1C3]PPH64020.1 hypothetical protein C5D25_06355 [Rathayibacter sp. AY1D7]PPI29935.1 hypothetical protein C5D66_10025 [Rathayibacter sp. AY1B4]
MRPLGRSAALLAVGATVVLLVGCASAIRQASSGDLDIGPYADVHPVLDPAAESIRTPTDACFLDEAALNRVGPADDLLIGACIRTSGRSFRPVEVDLAALPPLPDTSSGSWCPEGEARLGYGFDGSADAPMEAANQAFVAQAAADATWGAAADACDESVERPPHLGRSSGGDAAQAVAGSAHDVLRRTGTIPTADLRWEKMRSERISCSKDHGLRFDPAEPHAWGPEIPDDPDAAVRTAVVDVQCKEETRLIEKPTSLQSPYEVALFDLHRTEPDDMAQNKRAVLERADAVMARDGAAT